MVTLINMVLIMQFYLKKKKKIVSKRQTVVLSHASCIALY